MTRDLVVEIGCEEIPARLMTKTLDQLKARAEDMFTEQRLVFTELKTVGTPRRLVLMVKELAEETTARRIEIKGPPAKSAYDKAGQPTQAARGFARTHQVELASLTVRSLAEGQYVFATKEEPGRLTVEVLAQELPILVKTLSFPRPMRWGSGNLRFVRPIRWLLALFGDEVIHFSLNGLDSGGYTYGHRFLAPGPFMLSGSEDYVSCLEKGYVIVDPHRRKNLIRAQGDELAQKVDGRVLWTEDLLDEVAFLVEYPTVLRGSFAREYLDLPSDVIITPMRDHQRYFPVVNHEGDLLPYFVAVRNGNTDHLDLVRTGNERVLRARLADARFFFQQDLKTSLAQRVERLGQIVFQEGLGSLYDKSRRLISLVRFLTKQVRLDDSTSSLLERAAFLAKADLTTNMVNEFPELQGIMGREYALLEGEHTVVAQALAEQYLPRSATDELPVTLSGALLALSDKMDTIAGCFGRGLMPTGSEDPYGLRRLATGVINIMLDQGLEFSLYELTIQAVAYYDQQGLMPRSGSKVVMVIDEFLTQRLRIVLENKGIRYDVVEAVLAVLPHHPSQAYRRSELISAVRRKLFFADMVRAFIRVANLARQAQGKDFWPELLIEPAELYLYERYRQVEAMVPKLLEQEQGLKAIEQLSTLVAPIDNFFTKVLVMAEDKAVRANRLALLEKLQALALSIGDFSKLVLEAK